MSQHIHVEHIFHFQNENTSTKNFSHKTSPFLVTTIYHKQNNSGSFQAPKHLNNVKTKAQTHKTYFPKNIRKKLLMEKNITQKGPKHKHETCTAPKRRGGRCSHTINRDKKISVQWIHNSINRSTDFCPNWFE